MHRWTTALLGALLVAFLAVAMLKIGPQGPAPPTKSTDAGASFPDSGAKTQQPPLASAASAEELAPRNAEDAGPIPDLPQDAPKRVSFGVVLVTYRGAQGASDTARSKAEALVVAEKLLAEATESFDEAVKKGDRGSTKDAGRIPQGVLEKSLEYALFTLAEGAVHPRPLDSPRGYWILRRNK